MENYLNRTSIIICDSILIHIEMTHNDVIIYDDIN